MSTLANWRRPLEMCVYLAAQSQLLASWTPVDEDHLLKFADKFERLAVNLIDRCQSGAEAEAAIRTGGTLPTLIISTQSCTLLFTVVWAGQWCLQVRAF